MCKLALLTPTPSIGRETLFGGTLWRETLTPKISPSSDNFEIGGRVKGEIEKVELSFAEGGRSGYQLVVVVV